MKNIELKDVLQTIYSTTLDGRETASWYSRITVTHKGEEIFVRIASTHEHLNSYLQSLEAAIKSVEELDFKDLPKHINSTDELVRVLCKIRLTEG